MFIRLPAIVFLISLCVFSTGFSQEEGQEQKKEGFWPRFEREINEFVTRITRDFTSYDSELDKSTGDTSRSRAIVLSADTTIAPSDTVMGNVSFRNGNVTVRGTVKGNVEVYDGNLYLKDRGRIIGNVRIYNGRMLPDDSGHVTGSIDERTSSPGAPPVYDIPSDHWSGTIMQTRVPWQNEYTVPDVFIFRYNRVEGVFLGVGLEKRLYWDGRRSFGAFGSVGYGFASYRWRGNLGLTRQFSLTPQKRTQILEFGLEGYSLTDSKDQWRITRGENTAAAFFIHEEFRDYFGREGGSAFVAYYLRKHPLFFEGRAAFLVDQYHSLDNRADWALFGGDKTFRDNPAIDEGTMRSIQITTGVTDATRLRHGPDGWTAYVTAEFADHQGLGGEFTFQHYLVDIRRYQPLGDFDNLNLRLRMGTTHGQVPRQKLFELGGLGSIPAFRYKEFPSDTLGANRMILFNAEYVVNGSFLSDPDFWPTWLMRHVNLIFMADAGFVRSVSADQPVLHGFDGIQWTDFKSDLGVAVGTRNGSFRIGMVWRTDAAEPAQFVLRLSRPF